jgi:predicted dehydrogenase
VRAVAGWDHDATRLAAAAKQHGVDPFATMEDMLKRPDITAVVIAAETSMHADLVEKAARAGKAIIVQKPLALTLEQADRIVAAVERHAVPFTMAWQMRADPQNIEMRSLVHSGSLGKVFMVRRRHGLSTHTWSGFENSWHASHPIDWVYWMLGMPASVTAEMGSLLNPKIPNDNGIAIFRYADGAFAEVCCSFTCLAGENTTEIIAEKGVIIQNYGDAASASAPRPAGAVGLKWYLHETREWTHSAHASPAGHGERISGLAGPLSEFLNGRRPPIATALEGRDVLRLVLACYDSASQGRRILLD